MASLYERILYEVLQLLFLSLLLMLGRRWFAEAFWVPIGKVAIAVHFDLLHFLSQRP